MNKSYRWLLLIVGMSVLLRLAAAIYLGDQVAPEPGIYDQISYDALARNVVAGKGFTFDTPSWPVVPPHTPTSFWSFLYTLYLVGVYALLGPHPLAARIIQAIVAGALMPWLTFRLGRRAFGPTVGLVAAAISAVYVYFFFYGAALMTETFYMLAILWSFDLAGEIATREQRSRGAGEQGPDDTLTSKPGTLVIGHWSLVVGRWSFAQWLLLGLAMGIAVLLRQTFLPVVGLVGLWLWWATPGRRAQTIRGFLLSAVVVALMILPWTIRNYRVFGQLVLLNTNAGYAFFWANHPIHGTNFMTLLPPEISYQSLIPPELRGLDEASLDKALMQRGVQFVLDDPGRYLLLSLSRLRDQFKFWPSPDSSLPSNVSRVSSFGLFLPFMLYGTWLAISKSQATGRNPSRSNIQHLASNLGTWLRTPIALWLGFVVLYNAIHLASWAAIRYRLPTDAVMVIFAGLALTQLGEQIWQRRGRTAVAEIDA